MASSEIIGLQSNALDVNAVVNQPENGGCNLFGKLCRRENDSNILRKRSILRSIPIQEVENCRAGVLAVLAQLFEVSPESVDCLIKYHRRYHGGISDGLEVHVPPVLGALQLYNDEICCFVDSEKIDTTTRVLPFPELLSDHEAIGGNHFDILTK